MKQNYESVIIKRGNLQTYMNRSKIEKWFIDILRIII